MSDALRGALDGLEEYADSEEIHFEIIDMSENLEYCTAWVELDGEPFTLQIGKRPQ